jgi:hypothetical protein
MRTVTYEALTSRNAGFLDAREQDRLRESAVFVCGVGGMGGAAVEALARAGVGSLGIADFDVFEPTNLNRQVFASTPTLGRSKTEVTAEALLEINPSLRIRTFGADWTNRLDELLDAHDVVVNGMDDPWAGLMLYRAARTHGVTVVDAFTSPSPSVTVVRAEDPRPEDWLGFPTSGVELEKVRESDLASALLCELSYVAAVSSAIHRFPPQLIAEILQARRPRSSFAPVVLVSGNLMAFEAIGALLGRRSAAGYKGYFLDLASGRVERPGLAPLVAWRRRRAFRMLARLSGLGES